MKNLLPVALLLTTSFGTACKGSSSSKYPGTAEGAKAMLTDVRTSPDARAMTMSLRPTTKDYQAVFAPELADKAEKTNDKLWADPKAVISADPANTELVIFSATSEELKSGAGAASDFPGGYRKVAEKLQPGLTWYRWKYTKPGSTLGMAYDGLVFVNGHWAWFPKPWRAAE